MSQTGPAALLNDADCAPGGRVAGGNKAAVLSLRPTRSDTSVGVISLSAGRYIVGSDATSDIRLNLSGVHPRHCLIVAGPARAAIRAYAAPTRLNGRPVSDSPLLSGDRLAIGPVEFRVAQCADRSRLHAARIETEPSTRCEPSSGADVAPVSREAEALLNELGRQFDAADGNPGVGRLRENLLRRENDAIIAAAAVAESAARLQEQHDKLRGELERVAGVGQHLVRRERLLTELQRELLAIQSKLATRGKQQEETNVGIVERTAKLVAEQDQIEIETAVLDHRIDEHARQHVVIDLREQELARRVETIEQSSQDVEERSARLAGQEDAIRLQRASLDAERSRFESERQAIDRQREALHDKQKEIESSRRRLEAEREELAVAMTAFESERTALVSEQSELQLRRKQVESDAAVLFEERRALESLLDEEQSAFAAFCRELHDRETNLVCAECDTAWKQRDFEHEARDLELLRLELTDQQTELNRLSAIREALEVERSALRDEESRFDKARHDFSIELEQHRQNVLRFEETRRELVPKHRLGEAELRQSTTSLRDGAQSMDAVNVSRHSFARQRVELTVKGVLAITAVMIAVALFIGSFTSGGKHMWQTAAGYAAAVVIVQDFLSSLARWRRHNEPARQRDSGRAPGKP